MRYTVRTFKVRLEVAESGIRIRNSETAEIVARGIFNQLGQRTFRGDGNE
jgi:hypothetical protein